MVQFVWTVKLQNDLLLTSEVGRSAATVVHRLITIGLLCTIINYVQIIGLVFEVISRYLDLDNNLSS